MIPGIFLSSCTTSEDVSVSEVCSELRTLVIVQLLCTLWVKDAKSDPPVGYTVWKVIYKVMNQIRSLKLFADAALSALVITALILGVFLVAEPQVGRAVTDEFTVTQVVSDAISFSQIANDVSMEGTLDGLTGGTSLGTTTVRVRTNNASGYTMTIQFSSTTAMGRNGGGGRIPNFVYATSTAGYPSGFSTTPANAQFGFTVNASSTSEISDVFTHSGSLCGTGNNGSFTVNNCWRGASTTDAAFETELINSAGPTPASGSTSTVQFRITIPANPSPAVPNGTYVATATLTALEK